MSLRLSSTEIQQAQQAIQRSEQLETAEMQAAIASLEKSAGLPPNLFSIQHITPTSLISDRWIPKFQSLEDAEISEVVCPYRAAILQCRQHYCAVFQGTAPLG